MLNMTIHLSGRNVDVFGKIIHVNEPANEMNSGILKIFSFDLIIPIIPKGNRIAFITKKRTIRFTGL